MQSMQFRQAFQTKPKRLAVVIGTRPEAIKLAPVCRAAEASGRFDVRVILTGQHREMLDQVVSTFGLRAYADLDIMRPDQTLSATTSAALTGLTRTFESLRPDCVVVQGDTTSTFCGALAASFLQIPVAHVEAGLRTGDRRQPFPEEGNRLLTTHLTDYHFAPTDGARANLARENVAADRVWVTGNTSIDALYQTLTELGRAERRAPAQRTLLVTSHRRENQGEGLDRVCDAVLALVARHPDLKVVFPVHLSPRVRSVVFGRLSGHPRIELKDPLDYRGFVLAMDDCTLVLTDSGGVQEEAPALGKPVLVLREKTERPEAVDAGVARLVGTGVERIVAEVSAVLEDEALYQRMSVGKSPYGDGKASNRIVDVLAGAL